MSVIYIDSDPQIAGTIVMKNFSRSCVSVFTYLITLLSAVAFSDSYEYICLIVNISRSQTTVMKAPFALCTALIILSFSCKKTNDQINTHPVNDTTKPPVVNVDTSTLLKSMREYGYSGTIIVDSELMQWTYDDQRRMKQQTYAFGDSNDRIGNSNDTIRFTYLNDRYIQTFDGYTKGSLRAISNRVYYLGSKGRVDSIISSITGYGIEAGSNSSSATYYYYNQENQEILTTGLSAIQGGSLEDSVNYYYTGMNLDSATEWNPNPYPDPGMQKYRVSYFSDGNLTSQTYLSSDVFSSGVSTFTYTNIPIGGFFAGATLSPTPPFFYPATKLLSGSTFVPTVIVDVQTTLYTYELDAANRVTVMTSNTNGNPDYKKVFTYY